MKRRLIVTLIVLSLVLSLGIVCEYGSLRIAHSYQNAMIAVGLCLSEGDLDTALTLSTQIAVKWEKEGWIAQLWINHTDTDHVTQSLMNLRAAIIAHDDAAALIYYGETVENFGHLHHRDAFTLKNIL